MNEEHTHQARYIPPSGHGYATCDCGATLQYKAGQPVGDWHSCHLCTHPYGLPPGSTQPAPSIDYGPLDRASVIRRISAALKARSGKAWSVTGGKGTAYGWLRIDAPPKARTWHHRPTEGMEDVPGAYIEVEDGGAYGHTGPELRAELAQLLGLPSVHHQGVSVPASNDHYREYIDRAEGRTPAKIAEQYWD